MNGTTDAGRSQEEPFPNLTSTTTKIIVIKKARYWDWYGRTRVKRFSLLTHHLRQLISLYTQNGENADSNEKSRHVTWICQTPTTLSLSLWKAETEQQHLNHLLLLSVLRLD